MAAGEGADAGAAPAPLAAAPAPAAADAPASILSLPTEVEQQVFASLSTKDLAACMATCRAWRASASAPALWQAACARRWRHGLPANQRLSPGQEALGGWHGLYDIRCKTDARVLAALGELQWPDRHQAAMRRLGDMRQQLGFPAMQDVLQELVAAAEAQRQPHSTATAGAGTATAADWPGVGEWPDVAAAAAAAPCGAAYWARQVQEELCVSHCAQQLRHRRQLHDAAAAEYIQRDDAARAAAAAERGLLTISFGAQQREQRVQQWAQQAGEGDPRLPELSGEQLLAIVNRTIEEGALALAQVHNPFSDLDWVPQALDGLGAELRRRIEAAGAESRLDKLRLLNHLLFGPGPPPRHRHFAAIPPPDGYGLEITGNRERYYEAGNSLLDSLLTNREGIPISLAVLHAAVGARAGLPIQLLNVPMHVVTALKGEPATEGAAAGAGAGGAAAERHYIDVFDGGRIMSRAEFADFLQGLGLPESTGLDAQAMTPGQCWVRMCRNVLHIHREQQEHGLIKAVARLMAAAADEGSAEGMRAHVEVVNACLALEQFNQAADLLRHEVLDSPFQVQLVGGPQQASALQTIQTMMSEIEEAAEAHTQAKMRVHRREGQDGERVRFRVGQVLRHKRYHYRGVIVGWDPECHASEEWMQQMGVDRLPGGRSQPFYHVLPDPEDRPGQAATYVAQENIELEPLPALHRCKPGFALHPEAGRYFAALTKGGACYLLNDWMRQCYPDDAEQ